MRQEELQKIIGQFDEENLRKKGIFGIYQYGGGSDESFIRANKEGIELFAVELLKSAKDVEDPLSDTTKNIIPIEYDENWINENSDTFIHYIEPIAYKQELKIKNEYKPNFLERLLPYGCGFVLLVLLIFIIIGFSTVLNWIF